MKKKIVLLIISVIAYCYLFYGQSTGVNALIFDFLLITALLILDSSLVKSRAWVIVAAGTLVAGTGALLYGNFLSAFGNVFSLILLAHLSVHKTSSLVFSLMQSFWSYITIPYYVIERLSEPLEEKPASESKFSIGNLLKFTIPVLVLLIFFAIYRASNPVFDKFVSQIKLDFLSWNFIAFLLCGWVLLYGFFYQKKFGSLISIDQNAGNTLVNQPDKKEFSLFTGLNKESSAAVMTFVLLNLLLLMVNILDLQFILSGQANRIIDYSKYLHQGVNSSIFSILIAILVTLYFFRGKLNFFGKNKQLKWLALTWILLNVILLATCVHKNMSYIDAFGLTHKRIGVYFYLFLTFIGLVTTWIKISNLKSNWFLVRVNMWFLYLALVISSLFNWNQLIIDYNQKHKSTVEREYYFDNLGDTGLPLLNKKWKEMPSVEDYYNPLYIQGGDFMKMLDVKTRRFIKRHQKESWQSWNFEDERIYQALQD